MAKFIRHAFDIVNNEQVSGWCYSWLLKKWPLTLQFFLDGKNVGETVANQYRQDLKDLAVHPTGKCGFQFVFPPSLDLFENKVLEVGVKGRSGIIASFGCRDIAEYKADVPNIFFMHIPKTAGTSFNTYVRSYLPEKSVNIHLEAKKNLNSAELIERGGYLAGHLTLEKIKDEGYPSHFDLHTIVRNPYSHLHSHLNWVRSIASNKNRGFYKNHHPVIQDLAKLLDNTVDIESTLSDFIERLDGFEFDFFDNIQTRYFLTYRPDKVTQDDFLNSLENLSIFKTIGVTEKYDAFNQIFCSKYGFKYVKQPKPLNKATQQQLYDYTTPKFKELVQPLVFADVQLYDHILCLDIQN